MATTEQDPVLVEQDAGVVIITLNRPDKLNSFNGEMHRLLLAALTKAGDDPECRAVMLTGAGRAFSAGQDLSERVFQDGVAPDLSESLKKDYNPLVRTIRELEKPVLAAVNGVVAGAGANIALACDIVIASRSARFIQSFSKIGLLPDSGGTWTLPRLIGDARARALAFLAEPIDAELAAEWGMIWKAVEDELLDTEARKLCAHLASQPTRSFALMKKAFLQSAVQTFDQQLDLEAQLQGEAGRTEDYRTAVSAFRAKQSPVFEGR